MKVKGSPDAVPPAHMEDQEDQEEPAAEAEGGSVARNRKKRRESLISCDMLLKATFRDNTNGQDTN